MTSYAFQLPNLTLFCRNCVSGKFCFVRGLRAVVVLFWGLCCFVEKCTLRQHVAVTMVIGLYHNTQGNRDLVVSPTLQAVAESCK